VRQNKAKKYRLVIFDRLKNNHCQLKKQLFHQKYLRITKNPAKVHVLKLAIFYNLAVPKLLIFE